MNPDVSPAAPETPPAGPSNLRLRTIYGLLGAALLLGCVWFSPITFGLFFAFVQAVMLWEFYRMMRVDGAAPATWLGIAAGTLIFGAALILTAFYMSDSIISHVKVIASTDGTESNAAIVEKGKQAYMITAWFWESQTWAITFALPGIILVILTVVLLLRTMQKWPVEQKPFASIGSTLAGVLYISVPMNMLTALAFVPSNYDYRRIFALLFLIWASDIGAYAAGKTFGKHKMAPAISPGKTWEGWAGGFLLTLLVGWALHWLLPQMPLVHLLVAAGAVAVFAPLGDLAESMLKRSVGVKDSGSIMPGHGGLLDRFDAFLLVLPVLALLQLLMG